jgi:hypothetical protein
MVGSATGNRRACRCGLAALLFFVAAAGCATSSEPASVAVRNDLSESVTLAVCSARDCSKHVDPWSLKPGEIGAVNVEINGGFGPAVILRRGGSPIGCLPLRMSKRPPARFTVLASQAVPCGSSSGARSANGKDWPDPKL